jgi:diamine N-acetyltransferase
VSTMQIRTAQKEDIVTIQHLAALVWPHAYADIISPRQIAYMLHAMYSYKVLEQQMEAEGHRFLIATDAEQPIGFAGFGPVTQEEWKLHKLYVLPFLQQKGAGKQLIEAVEKAIMDEGGTSVVLNVNRENKAIGFYEHLGFTIYEQGDYPIGAGFFMNDYRMRKQLNSL